MYFFKISCVFKQLCVFCSIGNMRAACVGSPRLLLPAGTCAFPRRRLHRLRPDPARTANNTGSLPKHADGLPRLFTIKGNAAPRRQCPPETKHPGEQEEKRERKRKQGGKTGRREKCGRARYGSGRRGRGGHGERERKRGEIACGRFPACQTPPRQGIPPWTARVFALSFPRRCFSGGKRASSSFSDRRFLKGFHQRWQNLLFTAHHSRNPLFALLSGKCGIIRVTGIELHAEGPLDHPHIR